MRGWLGLSGLIACSGEPEHSKDERPPVDDADSDSDSDADADSDSDADTDSDADSDADTDTDTDPPTALATGCAVDRWDPADFDTVFDVGPGQPLETPSDVPWEALSPSTLVRIWPRAEPYRDKWVIATAGSEIEPVVVLGVCDPYTGALPVIDGEDATTRLELDFWSETRGVIKIGGSSAPGAFPSWVYVEDLEIRGGRAGHAFVDEAGAPQSYDDNAAAIFIEQGEHLTVRGCTLTDSGNGLFAAHETSDLLVSSNFIYGNGNQGSYYEHNNYTEADGIVFEFNRFGPLCGGCGGNNLKDRSAGTVIRYNWIEGGNRQLDLVESDYPAIRNQPSYAETFVYGNVLVEPDGDGNSQIAHYGGDNGDESTYRQGTLYFYANTVVSERTGNTTLVRLSDPAETLDARNNVLFAEGNLAILEASGTASLGSNWIVEGFVDSHAGGGFEGTVTDEGTNTTGADPGFTDAAARDFTLAPGAAPIDAGGALAPGVPAVEAQYALHQRGEERPDDGAPDQGALEAP